MLSPKSCPIPSPRVAWLKALLRCLLLLQLPVPPCPSLPCLVSLNSLSLPSQDSSGVTGTFLLTIPHTQELCCTCRTDHVEYLACLKQAHSFCGCLHAIHFSRSQQASFASAALSLPSPLASLDCPVWFRSSQACCCPSLWLASFPCVSGRVSPQTEPCIWPCPCKCNWEKLVSSS